MKRYCWHHYPKTFKERILKPFSVGFFEANSGAQQDMRVAIGQEGSIKIYLIVDETDGIIADAKFQAFGPSALIGVTDILCEMVLRKTYVQASRMSSSLLEKKIHDLDKQKRMSLPSEITSAMNTALSALFAACETCSDIQISEMSDSPPTPFDHHGGESTHQWSTLSEAEKLALIKEIISEEIQPFIALDAGGVEVLALEGLEVKIAYEGACVTCPSATGATLNAIQEMLRAKVHPQLRVEPVMDKEVIF